MFNHGASIPDTEASCPNREYVSQWKAKLGIDASNQVKIVKLAHMRYQHPDLKQLTTFLQDFGMEVVKKSEQEVWYRGYGTDPYVYYARKGPQKFLGGSFQVESYSDLEMAAKIQGAGQIQELVEAPGGGSIISLVDPEGNLVNFIFGQTPAEQGPTREKLMVNYDREKLRERRFQRFQEGPAAVHKLGHYGLVVRDLDKQLAWYTQHFNIVPTDLLYVPVPPQDGSAAAQKIVAMFGHIDRGKELSDHHTFFLSLGSSSHVHHASFEVHDFDTQHLGHQWLANKGYKSVWGVGRHVLGSQIFDYWWDTTGNMIEHYADGDLVNEDTPIGIIEAGSVGHAVWGPEIPASFLE